MGHRQLLQVAVWAVCLAWAGGAFAEPPPGSEAPTEYGEAEVETIIVIGNNYRCPDGKMVAALVECAAFQVFWWDTFFFVTLNSHGIIPLYQPDASACGNTPDANCACGSGKVKVYDDGNDTFHCKPDPPAAGCPKWDQKFDFDPNVWKCVARPLDATAQAAVDRIKGCFGTGSTVQDYLGDVLRFEYGSCPGAAIACISSCTPDGDVVTFDKTNIANRARQAPDATEWQWFAEGFNHELRHVYHNTTYGCQPWNNSNFWTGEQVPSSVPRNMLGEESWTALQALKEYHNELGVRSPYDSQYRAHIDKQLKNCPLW